MHDSQKLPILWKKNAKKLKQMFKNCSLDPHGFSQLLDFHQPFSIKYQNKIVAINNWTNIAENGVVNSNGLKL